MTARQPAWLRERGQGETRVTSVELFFDLVYVLAITQLTHLLTHHLSLRGAGETLLLVIAVWSAWVYTAWITNWFDPEALPVRLMLVGVMLGSLIMSASIPQAFGGRGFTFATAFAAIQIGRTIFVLAAVGVRHALGVMFRRVLIWWLVIGALWVAGGLAHHDARTTLWSIAVALDLVMPWNGYPVPGLGRSRPGDWAIAGEHLAERCQLFVIIALGESIMVAGAGFGELPFAAATAAAFVVAFLGSVALWWVYFDRGATAGQHAIATAPVPGRLGRSAYTYFHLPMVAGIIIAAAADELTIAGPTGATSAPAAGLILGGPALYLAGSALFQWALSERTPWSRLVAIAALAALAPIALVLSPLTLSIAATGVVVVLALWESRAGRARGVRPSAPPSR